MNEERGWYIRKPTKKELKESEERRKTLEDEMFLTLAKDYEVVFQIKCDKNDSVYGGVAEYQVGHFKIKIIMGEEEGWTLQ